MLLKCGVGEVPWTARRSNLSILKEISPGCSLEGLMLKVKEESEKAGLKLNTQKTKIMASSPITSWQIDGEKVETIADFNFLGYKITANNDCSHEIKKCLLLGRKTMTNLDSILKRKQRHHLAKYGTYSQSYGFSSIHVRL